MTGDQPVMEVEGCRGWGHVPIPVAAFAEAVSLIYNTIVTDYVIGTNPRLKPGKQ